MSIDRQFDFVEEHLYDQNHKCACGSGAIEVGEMFKNEDDTFTCYMECWDCENKWEVKVKIGSLVEVVQEDVFVLDRR